MTVELWCAAGVFLAPVGEDIVVLDVNADQYHCLLDGADWMVVGEGGSVTVAAGGIVASREVRALAKG